MDLRVYQNEIFIVSEGYHSKNPNNNIDESVAIIRCFDADTLSVRSCQKLQTNSINCIDGKLYC